MARQHRGFSGPKRQTQWIGPAVQSYVVLASGNKLIVSSFDSAASGLVRPTVIRTRGQVSVRPAAGVFGDIEVHGAYGVCIVNTDAFAAGVASIPGPVTDADWSGFFVWRPFTFALEAGDATGVTRISFEQEVDSKAMRKIGQNETLVQVCESQLGALRISMQLRFLFKLS